MPGHILAQNDTSTGNLVNSHFVIILEPTSIHTPCDACRLGDNVGQDSTLMQMSTHYVKGEKVLHLLIYDLPF
jgi:hypothetical protein